MDCSHVVPFTDVPSHFSRRFSIYQSLSSRSLRFINQRFINHRNRRRKSLVENIFCPDTWKKSEFQQSSTHLSLARARIVINSLMIERALERQGRSHGEARLTRWRGWRPETGWKTMSSSSTSVLDWTACRTSVVFESRRDSPSRLRQCNRRLYTTHYAHVRVMDWTRKTVRAYASRIPV